MRRTPEGSSLPAAYFINSHPVWTHTHTLKRSPVHTLFYRLTPRTIWTHTHAHMYRSAHTHAHAYVQECTTLELSAHVSCTPEDPAGYDIPSLLQLRQLDSLRLWVAGDEAVGKKLDCRQLQVGGRACVWVLWLW